MESLAKAIIRYRATHGMNQEEFAKKVGVDRVVISKAENGKAISKVTAAKIEIAIGE